MTAYTRPAIKTFLIIITLAFLSCKHKPVTIQRGFYYWKSDESTFEAKEINSIKNLRIQKLYVKFFEVEFSNIFGVRPVAKTSINFNYGFNNDVARMANIVPVVFIKNEVLMNTSKNGVDSLADNIKFLVSKKYKELVSFDKTFTELQIDCDWTATTKEKYFMLLKSLKAISGKTISCTLRMYPYKYPDIMGVPPVDKVTLMVYNLNNPLENENKNSILDVDELKKYLVTKKEYPLHIDIVLPLNSWMLCFQNNQFAGILHNVDDIKEIATPIKPLWYSVTKDTVIGDIFLRTGDKIKYEDAGKEELRDVIELLKHHISFSATTTVSFFHLDANALKKYDDETLDYLYNNFK